MVNPKNKNGFKVMNDQRELMKLMLPVVKNQGEEYKQLKDLLDRRMHEEMMRKRRMEQDLDSYGEDEDQIDEEEKDEEEEKDNENKKMTGAEAVKAATDSLAKKI